MSVSFNKTGVVKTSGREINPNILAGNYSCVTTSTSHTTKGLVTTQGINDLFVDNQGKKLWFSFDYSAEGERQAGEGSLGNRYGCHLSFRYNKTDGTLSSQMYPCASYLTMSGTGRAIMSYTLPTDIASVQGFSVAVQPHAKPASGNSATWYLRNLKLEIGDYATPWIPHEVDWGYVGGIHGFSETGDMMKVFENDIWTTEFIEW